MVGNGAIGELWHGEDVVVGHVVLVAIVVKGDGGFAVVRGVYVDSVVEDVGGRVGCVDVLYQGRGRCHGGEGEEARLCLVLPEDTR